MKNYFQKGNISKQNRQTRWIVDQPSELMAFLIDKMPGHGRNNIKSLLTHRQVMVGDKVVSQYNHPLHPGDEVVISWTLLRDEEHIKGLKIIYEDLDLIVIDKPAGLLSMASDTEKFNTAYRQLTDYVRISNSENRIFIVHRLDRETSGVMLFAKNEPVKRILQDNWKELVVDRAYLAVVEGVVEKKHDRLTSWLLETKTKKMYSASKPGDGLEAITNYRVLQVCPQYTLLEVRLETGRKNQIRVQMQDIGHSIIGDKKYSAATNPIGRLGLHAHILSFHHPVSGELMSFETVVPKKFLRLFN